MCLSVTLNAEMCNDDVDADDAQPNLARSSDLKYLFKKCLGAYDIAIFSAVHILSIFETSF